MFSYMKETSDTGHVADVYFRFIEWNNMIYLSIKHDRMRIVKRVAGTYSLIVENMSAGSTEDIWYDVYIRCEGDHVEVWRGLQGKAMTKVLTTDAAPFADTEQARVMVYLGTDAEYRYDNLGWVGKGSSNPLFLHLAEGSPCIDEAWTEWKIDEDTGQPIVGNPVPKRDFDDQLGPIDGDNDEPNHLPKRDIGADEWPTQDPGVISYWWERFFPVE